MFTLPGPRRFFADVAESLEWGKHAILVLPTPVSERGIAGLMRQILSERGLGTLIEVNLCHASSDSLYNTLAEGIVSGERIPPTMDELLQHTQCRSRFVLITNGYDENTEKCHRFNYLIRHTGELSQTIDDLQFQFLVIAKPTDPLPDRNLRLAIHPWWGVLGQLDVDLAVDEHLQKFPTQGVAEELWLRSVCKGVARGHPDLAKAIIETSPLNLAEVEKILDFHAKIDRYDISNGTGLRSKHSLYHSRIPSPPTSQGDKILWANDAISWIRGYGLVHHLDALSQEIRKAEIVHRVWIGEVELLMPIIESVRLDTVHWLNSNIGENWADQISENHQNINKEAILSEIGPLSYALKLSPQINKKHIPYAIIRGINQWRYIRNSLAHSCYVDYELIKKSVECCSKIHEYLD